MDVIYKYQLALQGVDTITAPLKFKPLHIDLQQGVPCLWALIDNEFPDREYKIYTYGTGHPIPDVEDKQYICTYQQSMFVWHVFMDKEDF